MQRPGKRGKKLEDRKTKKESCEERVSEADKQVCNGMFYGAKKDCGISLEKKVPRDRGALLEEEGDVNREYKAMHEENVLSSWLWEDAKEKEERTSKTPEGRSATFRVQGPGFFFFFSFFLFF